MYVSLREITIRANRLGQYASYTGAYDDMVKFCMDLWGVPKSAVQVRKDFENSDEKEDVYTVSTMGEKKRKFSIEIKS